MAFTSVWTMLAEVGGFWKSVRPCSPPFKLERPDAPTEGIWMVDEKAT